MTCAHQLMMNVLAISLHLYNNYLQTSTSLFESDCIQSESVIDWRQVASHQVTCAIALWTNAVLHRLSMLQH